VKRASIETTYGRGFGLQGRRGEGSAVMLGLKGGSPGGCPPTGKAEFAFSGPGKCHIYQMVEE